MAKTRRVQILMDPREFDLLERVARKRGSSVSDLMREAARAQYLVDVDRTRSTRAAQNFLSLPDVSLPDWKAVKNELADRHDKIVP
ncbi:MAG: CopG family transcriptional regulator [Myxococcales bacterium]